MTLLSRISLVLAMSGCGFHIANTGKPTDSGGGTTPSPTGGGGGVIAGACQTVAQPSPGDTTGLFTFTVPSTVNPCSVSGYLVGQETVFTVQAAVDGSYFIDKMPAGKNDIVVVGHSLASSLFLDSAPDLGIRLSAVETFAGKETKQGEVTLLPSVVVSGKIVLVGLSDPSGTDVYIPGTSYAAKAASDGSFTLNAVPSGTEELYVDHDGYVRGRIEGLAVQSGQDQNVGTITLVQDTGASGFLLINGGATSASSRTVSLALGATDTAILMKISEQQDFEGVDWVPLATSTTYTFATPGQKTLYAEFADANGLQSSPYSADITVNIFPDTPTALVASPTVITPPALPNVSLTTAAVPENAVSMEISNSSTFAGASWVPAASSGSFSLPVSPSTCGPQTIYVRYQDKDGFISPSVSAAIEIACWKPIAGANAPYASGYNHFAPAIAIDQGVFVYGLGDTANADAYLYSPDTNSWTQLAVAPIALTNASVVWTGQNVLIWGGYVNGSPSSMNQDILEYSPVGNTWTTVTPTNTIPGRADAGAVWTGTRMIVWGGDDSQGSPQARNDGGSYDPTSNTWTLISTTNAPTARQTPTLVWTGTKVIAWGGELFGNQGNLTSGGAYDPVSDTWSTISPSPSMFSPGSPPGVWTGSLIIAPAFAGGGGDAPLSFISYDPTQDTWQTYAPSTMPFSQSGYMIDAWFDGRMLMFNLADAMMVDPLAYQ